MEILEEVRPPRNSALVCWPVEWVDETVEPPAWNNLHVTCLYIPNVLGGIDEETEVELPVIPKEDILVALRDSSLLPNAGYRLVDVIRPDAFGPNEDVPVLKVGHPIFDKTYIHGLATLQNSDIHADMTYDFSPHVSVPLPYALRPPKQVLIRPLELWYSDDAPVVL